MDYKYIYIAGHYDTSILHIYSDIRDRQIVKSQHSKKHISIWVIELKTE